MIDAFSMEECTELLGVSKDTVKRLLKSEELEPVKDERKRSGPGRKKRLISVSSVSRYINKKMAD